MSKNDHQGLSWRERRSFIVLGVLVMAIVAFADPEITANDILEFDESMSFFVEINEGEADHTLVETWREPLISGTFRVTVSAKSKDATETLTSVRLLVADDDNDDGVIEGSERTLVTSATAVAEGVWRVARGVPVVISAFKDAYIIEMVWDRDGEEFLSAEYILHGDLEFEDYPE